MRWRLAFFNFVFLGLVIVLDQVSKSFIFPYSRPLVEFDLSWLVFKIVPSVNENFAFSIQASQQTIALIVGAVFLFVASLFLKQIWEEKQESLWLAIILGGAIGNIIDRFIYGGVIDWIDITLFQFSWSSFNFADIAIITGVLGWIGTSLIQKKK